MRMQKKEAPGCTVEEKYKDIIDLPRPTSPTRQRMSPEARAAQFASFAALTGYEAAVVETARLTENERELTEEKKSMIDEVLFVISQAEKGSLTATVTYFRPDGRKSGGAYVTQTAVVKEIDPLERRLVFVNGQTVPVEKIESLTIEQENASGVT